MVTYTDLFAFCGIMLGVIQIAVTVIIAVMQNTNNKKK